MLQLCSNVNDLLQCVEDVLSETVEGIYRVIKSRQWNYSSQSIISSWVGIRQNSPDMDVRSICRFEVTGESTNVISDSEPSPVRVKPQGKANATSPSSPFAVER